MYCRNCGTFLNEGARFCPNCGQPQGAQVPTTPQRTNQPYQPAPQRQPMEERKNTVGLVGFIFAIISIFANYAFCLPGLIGFILSCVGMSKRKKCSKWNGITTAGFVINLLFFIGWAIVWIAVWGTNAA